MLRPVKKYSTSPVVYLNVTLQTSEEDIFSWKLFQTSHTYFESFSNCVVMNYFF